MTLKGKTITDPVVLERLAEARKKALVVRQANAEARKDKKLLDDIELKQNKEMVKTKLSKLTNKVEDVVVDDDAVEDDKPKAKPKKVKKIVKPAPVEIESESEEEAPIVKKKSKKKAPKVVYETESSSSEEEVIVRRKKKIVATPRYEPEPQQIAQPEPPLQMPPKHDPIGDLYHRLYGR